MTGLIHPQAEGNSSKTVYPWLNDFWKMDINFGQLTVKPVLYTELTERLVEL